MGRRARQRPERLAEKLRQIRNALGFSQSEMLRRLGFEESIVAAQIAQYELGKSEPPLPIVLEYARLAGVPTEVLIDDELDLPENLPGTTNHEEIKRKYASLRKKRWVYGS